MAAAEIDDTLDLVSRPDQKIEQWAVRVSEFSSQYDSDPHSWAATAAVGAPRVYPRHGDIRGAWAPGDKSSNEYIVLVYKEPLYIDTIDIYETYNAGAVTKVSIKDMKGNWHILYQSPAQHIASSRILNVEMKPTIYKSDTIRLEIDCTPAGTWCEIDAVKMVGVRTRLDPPPPMTKLSDDMSKLVNSGEYSDVTFLIDDHEVKGHRAILSARSDYFRAMFRREASQFVTEEEGKIRLRDISYDAFTVMLQYLYTNTILDDPSPVVLAEVIRVADMYNMKDLDLMATYQLNLMVNIDNVIEIYKEAMQKMPVLPKVEKVCLDFITKNLRKVCTTPAFCTLDQEIMLTIIQVCTERLDLE